MVVRVWPTFFKDDWQRQQPPAPRARPSPRHLCFRCLRLRHPLLPRPALADDDLSGVHRLLNRDYDVLAILHHDHRLEHNISHHNRNLQLRPAHHVHHEYAHIIRYLQLGFE